MPTRFLAPALLGAGITTILFWIMTVLIAIEEMEIYPDPIPVVEWVTVRQSQPPEPKERSKPKRPPVPNEPVAPRLTAQDPSLKGIVPITNPIHPKRIGRDPREGILFVPADGDAVPMVRVSPRYPERALARGIEGRVLVEFTITAAGNVRDAHVVAAEPSNVFNKSAVDAVRQWRYTPKIVNGHPVERAGMRISIPFRRGGEEQS
jgi:protein TonB